jgi:hypothetical protein
MSAIPYVSNRFAMKRFLGMTDEELAENERLWREENEENLEPLPGDASAELRAGGISSAGIESDLGGMEDEAPDGEAPIEGAPGEGPDTVTGQELGGEDATTAQTV